MSSRAGLGLVLLVAGALWLLSVTDVLDLPYGVTIGILLILVGVVIALTPGRHGLLTLVDPPRPRRDPRALRRVRPLGRGHR